MGTAATTIRDRFSGEAANWNRLYSPEGSETLYEHNLLRRRKTAIEFLGRPTGRILDIGCGPGNVTLDIEHDGTLTGTDFALPMLRQASDSATTQKKRVNLMASDATALPLASSSTNTVLVLGLLEYISDPRDVLQEIHRILQIGGTLVLSFPNARSPFVWVDDVIKGLKNGITRGLIPAHVRKTIKSWLGKNDESYFTHKRHRFVSRAIMAVLEDQGYEILEKKCHTYGFGFLNRSRLNLSLCRKLESWATTNPKLEKLGWTIVLKTRKRF